MRDLRGTPARSESAEEPFIDHPPPHIGRLGSGGPSFPPQGCAKVEVHW